MKTIYRVETGSGPMGPVILVEDHGGALHIATHVGGCRISGTPVGLSPEEARLLGEAIVAWSIKEKAK